LFLPAVDSSGIIAYRSKIAERGYRQSDSDRYLDVIAERVSSGQGLQWLLHSLTGAQW
jgi:hypothetical protein